MEVMVRVGVTLNLGNYESMRVDVESGDGVNSTSLVGGSEMDDAKASIDEHYEMLEEKLLEKAALFYARLQQEGLIRS